MKKDLISTNIVRWLISFVLAVIVWLSFSYYLGERVVFSNILPFYSRKLLKDVPVLCLVDTVLLSTHQIEISPQRVDLFVRGRKKFLKELSKEDMYIYVRVPLEGEGQYVMSPQIHLPKGVHFYSEVRGECTVIIREKERVNTVYGKDVGDLILEQDINLTNREKLKI